MVSALLQAVLDRLNERKSRLLLVAQAALSESQYQAFRKLTLDELGRSGLEKELEELFRQHKDR